MKHFAVFLVLLSYVWFTEAEEELASVAESSIHVPLYGLPFAYTHYGHTAHNLGLLAIAELKGSGESSISGTVVFFQPRPPDGTVFITGNITGVPKGQHGFHIHRDGDRRNGCESMGPHYNPFLLQHGGPIDTHRHVGDLGNVEAAEDGTIRLHIADDLVSLVGPLNIVGRGIVVHVNKDDLGRGGDSESLKTGNAGARLACGIIGYAVP